MSLSASLSLQKLILRMSSGDLFGEKLLRAAGAVPNTEFYPNSIEVPSAKFVKREFYRKASLGPSAGLALIMEFSALKDLLVA
jgi:hypothetical protein